MGIQAVHFPNTALNNSDGIFFAEAPCLFEGGSKVSFGFRCYRTHSPTSFTDSRLVAIADGVNENDHSLMCSQISTTGFRVRIRAGATTSTHVTATGVFLQDTYYDWVATYDGATLRLYRNGAELTSGDFPATLSGSLGRDAGMRLGIGNNGVSENRAFGGFLADPWIDWHTWEPPRVAAYHDGDDLANLVVAPELWSRLDDWPDGSANQERGIPNLAAGSMLGRGVTQGSIEGGIMPGVERRAFVQVIFPDFPVLDAGGQTVNLGQPSETDTALPLTAIGGPVAVQLGLAQEVDSAPAMTPAAGAATVTIGQPSETDTAHPMTASGGDVVALGQPAETDSALPITPIGGPVSVPLGVAADGEVGLPLTPAPGAAAVGIGQPSETDTALPLTPLAGNLVALGQPVETDTALPMTAVGGPAVVPLGLAVEIDTARPLAAIAGGAVPAVADITVGDRAATVITIGDRAATLITIDDRGC